MYYRYLYSVRHGGEGIELCGEHLQELYTVYLTDSEPEKIALPPQKQKSRRGGGLTQINTAAKFLYRSISKKIYFDLELISYWPMGEGIDRNTGNAKRTGTRT
jgi:hypothetical protein